MSGGIIIIGLNGCGKSTVCRELAQRLNIKSVIICTAYSSNGENKET